MEWSQQFNIQLHSYSLPLPFLKKSFHLMKLLVIDLVNCSHEALPI